MYEPENENEISHQTEEDSGEYRYGGGFEKEDIYADAHYTPAGESTVPPRYYTPPEPKKTVKREKSGRGGGSPASSACVLSVPCSAALWAAA